MNRPPFLLYIVDDDEDDLLFIHSAFRSLGFDNVCKGFYNGTELMQHLKFSEPDELPDVLILDYEMPKMNGREILKKIRNLPEYNSIPVIFYSDRIDEKLETELKELGAFCCIRKGVTQNDQTKFAKAITEFLRRET